MNSVYPVNVKRRKQVMTPIENTENKVFFSSVPSIEDGNLNVFTKATNNLVWKCSFFIVIVYIMFWSLDSICDDVPTIWCYHNCSNFVCNVFFIFLTKPHSECDMCWKDLSLHTHSAANKSIAELYSTKFSAIVQPTVISLFGCEVSIDSIASPCNNTN